MSNSQEPLRNWLRFNPHHLVALDDVGGRGYQAAVILDPDGEETYALLSTSALEAKVPFKATVVPFHESLGRLPNFYQRRIEVVMSGKPHRDGMPCCGRLTQVGQSCRKHVRYLGKACYLHRKQSLPGDAE